MRRVYDIILASKETKKKHFEKELFTMKYTKKAAAETIKAYAEMTSYFDNSITQNELYDMLRYRMRFGEAETRTIIASLVLAGAKFKAEN